MSWISSHKPFILAGPCSAESPEQLESTFEALAQKKMVHMFRAGVWKPRTRPDSFEGMGSKALPWLANVKKKFNIPVAVEVANSIHVEQCLKYEIDALWIGARSTVSPFTVQEIADSLKGTDIPILIKNPVNPDLQLWIGALERIQKAGITQVAAVHRGYSYYGDSMYRNLPNWEIPIEFKRLRPEIPMLCDPSHIAGNTELIPSICQKALDLNFDGLMIESHIDPSHALSDPKQQLTPDGLETLLKSLIIRSDNNLSPELSGQIQELRNQIDLIDRDVFNHFLERMKLAEIIGEAKRDNHITILKLRRWDQIIKDRVKMGIEMGLSEEFVKGIMQLVHKESIRIQNEVMNQRGQL